MLDPAGEVFPDANCQRFTIHFYRRTQLATDVPHKTLFFTDEESGAITAILLLYQDRRRLMTEAYYAY